MEYRGYTIEEDSGYGFTSGEQYIIYPTEQGIDHDYDLDDDSWRYCGNCRWSSSIEGAMDTVDDILRTKSKQQENDSNAR